MSEWSPWLRINSSRDGSYQEERFRCVCKAVVVDPLQLRTPSLKTSMRFCTPGGEDCDTGFAYLFILIILLIYCTTYWNKFAKSSDLEISDLKMNRMAALFDLI